MTMKWVTSVGTTQEQFTLVNFPRWIESRHQMTVIFVIFVSVFYIHIPESSAEKQTSFAHLTDWLI
jgi:hypothetical protein